MVLEQVVQASAQGEATRRKGVECTLVYGRTPLAESAERLVKGNGRRVSERLERALAYEVGMGPGGLGLPDSRGCWDQDLGRGVDDFRPNRTTAICSHRPPRRLRSQLINVLNGARPVARGRSRGRAPTEV